MADCHCGCDDRNECRCPQDCEDCHQPVHLFGDCEWPEGAIRCWGCGEQVASKAIELLKSAKDALPSDDMVYLRIREFLDQVEE
jgi:hypothetical protein